VRQSPLKEGYAIDVLHAALSSTGRAGRHLNGSCLVHQRKTLAVAFWFRLPGEESYP
jgi:hypothetical protein